jgi:chromate transporter
MQTIFSPSKGAFTHDGSFVTAPQINAAANVNSLTPDPSSHQLPAQISILEAFFVWLRLGFISFGGPAGHISILHSELVVKRRWLSEERFLHALNYCILLPGPEGQQLATYIGWLMHRTWGGIMSGILFVLPAFMMLIALSWMYMLYGNTAWLVALFYGVKPAIVAIIVQAIIQMGRRTLSNYWLWLIAILAFIIISVLPSAFSFVVIAAAIIGGIVGRLYPAALNPALAYKNKTSVVGDALARKQPHAATFLDDETPTPFHALHSKRRFNNILTIGLGLWLLPIVCFWMGLGWNHVYTQLAWFFTKAAVLSFGGAYSMLPYIDQGAVGQYHWLTAEQALHGIALSEATPGPLVIMATFVGFLAGYGVSPSPSMALAETLFSGLVGACVATWFTFLPSFIFIFIGAPVIERTRKNFNFIAPLNAINAAVTGVILILIARFSHQALFPKIPDMFAASPNVLLKGLDGIALMIALLAMAALFRYKRNPLEVLIGAALLGFLITYKA